MDSLNQIVEAQTQIMKQLRSLEVVLPRRKESASSVKNTSFQVCAKRDKTGGSSRRSTRRNCEVYYCDGLLLLYQVEFSVCFDGILLCNAWILYISFQHGRVRLSS